MIRELAPAKLNLVLQVGRPRPDGLHPICSLFASLDLADELELAPREGSGADVVECPGVTGVNLAAQALAAFRERAGGAELPPLQLTIEKRIPVAAGLGGGSADAAAALRAANRLAGEPLDHKELLAIAAGLGSDVPSQVTPGHAIVQGTGEVIEPVALPALAALLVPHEEGLAAAAVYAELDRVEGWREQLEPETIRALLGGPQELPAGRVDGTPEALAAGLDNDLQAAALSLRPELGDTLAALRATGAPAAGVSGSGPACFALFPDPAAAELAARDIPGALVARLRS